MIEWQTLLNDGVMLILVGVATLFARRAAIASATTRQIVATDHAAVTAQIRALEHYTREMFVWGGQITNLYLATLEHDRAALRVISTLPNAADLLRMLPPAPAGGVPAMPAPPGFRDGAG